MWSRGTGQRRQKGREARARPGQQPVPRSWLQAFRGARHSAILFLVMIYSTAAVSEISQAGGSFSEDPACGRMWHVASRSDLSHTAVLPEAGRLDISLVHRTTQGQGDDRPGPGHMGPRVARGGKEGNGTVLEERKPLPPGLGGHMDCSGPPPQLQLSFLTTSPMLGKEI